MNFNVSIHRIAPAAFSALVLLSGAGCASKGYRALYTPIDADMLARYRMFAKLGFFGVEQRNRRGAVQFLRTSEVILQSPNHVLAVTPQSRFADVRERPVRFPSNVTECVTFRDALPATNAQRFLRLRVNQR